MYINWTECYSWLQLKRNTFLLHMFEAGGPISPDGPVIVGQT